MKRYIIRCPYCGSQIGKWEWILKLQLLFKSKYYFHCPVCHKQSCWKYFFHLRHDSTDKAEREFNRYVHWDNRIE